MTQRIGHVVILVGALLSADAAAQDLDKIGDIKSGQKLAREACRSCHDIGPGPRMPKVRGAPPSFYDVANMASTTPTSLYVFLHTSHPSMPNIRLEKKESDDVIAYILSLRRQIQ